MSLSYLVLLFSFFLPLTASLSIIVSDAQTSTGNVGTNAIDGNNATFWHSLYKPTAVPLPHTATLDLGSVGSVRGFTYLPRQLSSGSMNGNIGQHDILISTDGSIWTTVVSKAVFADTRDFKSDPFPDVQARYVRIIAYTEAGNRGPWTSAAEFGVVMSPSNTNTPSTSSTSSSTSTSSALSTSSSYSTSSSLGTSTKLSTSSTLSISSTWSTSSSYSTSSSLSVSSTSSTSSVPSTLSTSTLSTSTTSSSTSTTSSSASSSATISGKIAAITVDCYQPGNEGSNAIDGISTTIWHTLYKPNAVALPHNAVLDLGIAQQVTGFTYLPRQDGGVNGRIGQYQISTSTDTNIWTPATNGTFADSPTLKNITFPPVLARYVRIIALTEAGNRGPWTSAAEFGVQVLSASAPSVSTIGKWGPIIALPLVAAGGFVVPESGNVIVFSRSGLEDTGARTGNTYTATYNFVTGNVSLRNVMGTKHDMFCPGMSRDFAGKTIVSGGDDASKVSVYQPNLDTWVAAPQMKLLRGYQASTTISDGRTFIIGGSWLSDPTQRGGKNAEIFDETTNQWTLLPGCPVAPMLTNDNNGIYRADNHGWLFAWSNSSIFQAGPSLAMNWYSALGSGSTTPAGSRGGNDSMCGVAVLYDAVAGKIFTAGGSPSYENVYATNNAHLITLSSPNNPPSVAALPSMNYARSFANGVVLPNGKVFIIGGQPFPVTFTDTNAVMTPELWDPVNQTFTVMAQHQIPRVYHSIALLLLDGTVFSAGGGLCGICSTNHLNAEIYSPGYLFNADGSAATRPVITSVSGSQVVVGGSLTITTDVEVVRFAMVRYGTATHTVDTDQRRIPFDSGVSGTVNTITLPSDPGVVLPGYWMIFALDAKGVPSVAKTVQVTVAGS